MTEHECQGCDCVWNDVELVDTCTHLWPGIPDLGTRVAPGDLVPSAECPHCGALVVPRQRVAHPLRFLTSSENLTPEDEAQLNLDRVAETTPVMVSRQEFQRQVSRGDREVLERALCEAHGAQWDHGFYFRYEWRGLRCYFLQARGVAYYFVPTLPERPYQTPASEVVEQVYAYQYPPRLTRLPR